MMDGELEGSRLPLVTHRRLSREVPSDRLAKTLSPTPDSSLRFLISRLGTWISSRISLDGRGSNQVPSAAEGMS
jgi:hypothetical protein